MTDTPPAVTTTTPAGPAATTSTTAPVGNTPPAWYSTMDAEMQGHIQNRGWDKLDVNAAAAEAVKAHRNAEHKLGIPADRILRLPEKLEGDAMGEIYDRLGRPAAAKDYAFKVPEGMQKDEAFEGWAQGTFHKLGLSKAQAEGIVAEWHAMMGGRAGDAKKAHETAVAADLDALKKDWGAAYQQNDHIAGRAAETLGLSKEEVQGIQANIGAKRTLELLYTIGSKTMEDSFEGGAGGGLGPKVLTPGQALAKITDLRNDAEFRKKLIAGDVTAKAEWDRLNAMAVAQPAA